jgi:thiol-disulfide isomerase/thioredoxin
VRERTNWLYWIAGAAIVAIVLWQFLRPQSATQATGPAALQGQVAPSFAVPSMSGATSQLAAYRGRVVVMNLWASWCPPCRAEMPDLQRLYQTYKTQNLIVLGVDQGESAQRVGAFAQSLGIHYPILLDQQQQYGRVYAALGLPTTILVDRSGVVVRGFDGPLSYQQMVAAVTPLLGKAH